MSATDLFAAVRNHEAIRYMDKRRGHRFVPPKADTRKVPDLYATGDAPMRDATIWLHYFAGGCDWWIAELGAPEVLDDGTVSWRAFGYACLGDPGLAEWGTTDLFDLATTLVPIGTVRGAVIRNAVERDCYWTPAPAAECIPILRHRAG